MIEYRSIKSLAEIFDVSPKTISRLIDGMTEYIGLIYPPESVLTKPKRVDVEALRHWWKWKDSIRETGEYPTFKN